MFIPPKYKCNYCGKEENAIWTGEPHWEMPYNWEQILGEQWGPENDKHFCSNKCKDYYLNRGPYCFCIKGNIIGHKHIPGKCGI